tara:strand:- start:2046 stop:2345 length:300 start_codon:yes stop_codon:yes gene_type:complete
MAEQAEKKFQIFRGGAGGGGASNISRTIRHLSQNKSKIVTSLPDKESGQNGDVVYYRDPKNLNKISQYVKLNNAWINMSDGRPVNDSAVVRKFVKAKTE